MQKIMEKLVTRNIRDETLGYVPYISNNLPTNQGSPQKLQCTMWLHIYRKQQKTESYTWAFLDIQGVSKSTSSDITMAAKWHGLGDTLVMDWLHAEWQKNYSHTQEKHWRGLWPSAVHRGGILLPHNCEALSLTDSQKESGMAVIHWICAILNSVKFTNTFSRASTGCFQYGITVVS